MHLLARFILTAVIALQISAQSFAKEHRFGIEYTNKIQNLLYENGRLSPAKLQAYTNEVLQRHREVVGLRRDGRLEDSSLLINKYREQGLDDAAVIKKLQKTEAHVTLMQAVERLERLNSQSRFADVLETVKFSMDMADALKKRGYPGVPRLVGEVIEGVTQRWKIPTKSKAEDEASNLYIPSQNRYLSYAEIETIKRSGGDLSLYDPASSSFWQNQGRISAVDVRKASRGQNLDLYKGVDTSFPETPVFTLEEIKHSDTKPKLEIFTVNSQGKKVRYKMKIGAEVHSEPTAAALMATLGFPADITKYERNIKVYLGDKTLPDLKRDWESYYTRDALVFRYKIEDYISEFGFDKEKSQQYVVFKDGVLEAKPSEIERHGRWHFGYNSHDTFREVRGLTLVQMWLDNPDITDFRNNKLLYRTQDDGTIRPFSIITDMGTTFGSIFGSKPEAYSWEMIDKKTRSNIYIKYLALPTDIKGKLTYSDAKWATRKIAQLSRQQIAEAFAIGGWPQCVQTIYVEKIISRRNDLVRHFGLTEEYPLMAARYTKDQLKYNSICDQSRLEQDYTSDFELTWAKALKPIERIVKNMTLTVAQGALNSKRRIVIRDDEFAFEKAWVSEIILDVKREIETNPDPQTEQDLYIVKDQLEVGLRLGVKYGPFADLIYTKKYTLVYPARTMAQARTNNGFIANVLLPLDIAKRNLPPSYVIETQHLIDAGVGVRLEDKLAFLSPGLEIRNSPRVLITRSVLKKRFGQDIVVFRERTKYSQKIVEAFTRVAILKIPLFEYMEKEWGFSAGGGVVVDEETYQSDAQLRESVWTAMQDGDFTAFDSTVKRFETENRFSSQSKSWNLLFWSGSTVKQLDDIKFTILGKTSQSLQYSKTKERSGGVPFFNETKGLKAAVYSNALTQDAYQLELTFESFDSDTKTKEMSQAYIRFVNSLHPQGKQLIPFTPELGYTITNVWGPTTVNAQIIFYPEAVEKLIRLTDAQFWSAMASALGTDARGVHSLMAKYDAYIEAKRNKSPVVNYRQIRERIGISYDEVKMISAAKTFLRAIAKAKRTDQQDKLKLVRRLADAMHKANISANGFFDPVIFRALIDYVGLDSVYSRSVIGAARGSFIEGQNLRGTFGKERPEKMKYLNYLPDTPAGLYDIFADL